MPNNNNGNQVTNDDAIEQLNAQQQPAPELNKYTEFKLKRSAEEIGFMPPRKEKKKEMSKGEKTFFLVIIAVLILVIAGGLYFILRKAKDKVEFTVNPKNVVITLKSKPSNNPTYYATFSGVKPENCVVNTSNIDTSKEGSYKFVIICGQNTYSGLARVEGGMVIYKEDVTLHIGDNITPDKFIVKCKYRECESEFILDEGIDINAEKEEELNIKIKTCEKGSSDKCIESDVIRLKKVPKIIEAYDCKKQIDNDEKQSATILTVSVQMDNVGNIAGKIKVDYSYSTRFLQSYEEEKKLVVDYVKRHFIENVSYDDDNNSPYLIKYSYEEIPNEYKTKQEFINYYINELGYECKTVEIKTSD